MEPNHRLAWTSVAATVVAGLGLYGCGGGSRTDAEATSDNECCAPYIVITPDGVPIAVANSPVIGVPFKATCANGVTTTATIGTNANPGMGAIALGSMCSLPIRIEAAGPGKMRPLGAKADGSEDVPYDPTVNLPLSTIIPSGIGPFPVNPLTTLVANQVTSLGSENRNTLAVKKAQVAGALGLSAADLDKDYRNANVAAASTMIVEVAALAAATSATGALPAIPTGSSLGQVIAKNLAAQVAIASPNAMNTAAGIAAALKAADPKLDVTAATTSLADIDSDTVRVNNLIAANTAGATSMGQINKLVSDAFDVAAAKAPAARTATEAQLIADTAARKQQTARDALRSATAKLIADVAAAAPSAASNAIVVAREAAKKIVADTTVSLAQSGATPADLAAQAKAVAEGVVSAIKEDLNATTKVFAVPPALGNANIAAALVAKAQDKASAVTAATTAFDASAAGSAALKVSAAFATFTLPPASGAVGQAAQAAAIAATAAKTDEAMTLNVANMQTLVGNLQTSLQTLIGGAVAADGSTEALAQQAARTMLTMNTEAKLDFQSLPPMANMPSGMPTTTTTSSTSSTSRLTTTTASAATTSTAAGATSTTTLCGDPFGPPPSPGQTPNCGTTTAATTTSTTQGFPGAVTTTTLCGDPFGPPPSPGQTPSCGTTTTTATITSTTQAFPGESGKLDVTVGSNEQYTSAGKYGLGTLVNGAPVYSAAPVEFGPYTVSGLGAPATLSVASGTTSPYVSLKVNGGAVNTSAAVGNGDTLSIYFDFAACIAGSKCGAAFGARSYFSIQNGTTSMIFDVSMCSNPDLPPVTWSKQCK